MKIQESVKATEPWGFQGSSNASAFDICSDCKNDVAFSKASTGGEIFILSKTDAMETRYLGWVPHNPV